MLNIQCLVHTPKSGRVMSDAGTEAARPAYMSHDRLGVGHQCENMRRLRSHAVIEAHCVKGFL